MWKHGEQIHLLLKKSLKVIKRTLFISNSNKMQSLLNASIALHTFPVGLLKRRESSKNPHEAN